MASLNQLRTGIFNKIHYLDFGDGRQMELPMGDNLDLACPLCGEIESSLFLQGRRTFWRCSNCQLIFVPAKFHLSLDQEKAEYDQHENSPRDMGYRKFLSRTLDPVLARISPGSRGLDFGSGPGPTLSKMFQEAGHSIEIYDPFFAPNDSVLAQKYDFVTATEVVEHLRNPQVDLARIWNCVGQGGLLAIMTKLALGHDEFSKWHYKNDPTHVSFYSRATFQWLAKQWNAKLTFEGSDVMILERS